MMTDSRVDGGDILREIWERRRRWSFATFGPPDVRGALGPLRHLEKEAREAQEQPTDIFEYADCLLLVMDAADRAGFSLGTLMAAAMHKLEENESREWPDWRGSDPTKPIEHIREGSEFRPSWRSTRRS